LNSTKKEFLEIEKQWKNPIRQIATEYSVTNTSLGSSGSAMPSRWLTK